MVQRKGHRSGGDHRHVLVRNDQAEDLFAAMGLRTFRRFRQPQILRPRHHLSPLL